VTRAALAACLLAACYEIPYTDATRCSAAGECPPGRACVAGRCLTGGAAVDAAPPDAPPVPVLVVTKEPGGGAGTVRSAPEGLVCDGACEGASTDALSGPVRLEARPDPGSMFLGWSGACAGVARSCDLTVAGETTVGARFGPIAHNLVFFTSETVRGDFGGPAAGDALCARLAEGAGLSGTFRALLRVGASPARNRLVRPGGGDPPRGFVRMDGLPVGDAVSDLFERDQVFYPVRYDENGREVDPRATPGRINKGFVWTGEGGAGPAINCVDWSRAQAEVSGTGGVARGGPGELWASYGQSCAEPAPIYCVMVDRAESVAPAPPPEGALRLFVTRATMPSGGGLAAAGALCDAERPAGGAAFRPLLSTTAAAGASLLAPGRTYVRVDGAVVGAAEQILDVAAAAAASDFGRGLASGIWQSGDGGYVGAFSGTASVWTWTGASDLAVAGTAESTCGDWQVTEGAGIVGSIETSFLFWRSLPIPCAGQARVYCVEALP
jgi:hypothetical protein